VFTDPLASASGYPFKVVALEDSLSEADLYEMRPRICDLGYLRTAYKRSDGTVGFRCPSEPVDGYPQLQKGNYLEPPLVTAGKELSSIVRFIPSGQSSYSALDVLQVLLTSADHYEI
jgi:nitronate monooxygenase